MDPRYFTSLSQQRAMNDTLYTFGRCATRSSDIRKREHGLNSLTGSSDIRERDHGKDGSFRSTVIKSLPEVQFLLLNCFLSLKLCFLILKTNIKSIYKLAVYTHSNY